MLTLLAVTVVLLSLILLAVIVGAVFVVLRLSRAAQAAERTLVDLSDRLPGTLQAAEDALRSVEAVANRAEREFDRVDSVLHSTDRLLSGAAVAEAAVKTVRSGKLTIGRVLSGALDVLKALKNPGKTKEGSENE